MRREKTRKLMFILLSLCVMIAVITLVPAGGKKGEVNAEGETTGDYGNGITWEWVEAQNKLIFKYSGTGKVAMKNYTESDPSLNYLPFSMLKDKKNVSVEIQSGISCIGDYTFYGHNYISSVTMDDSVIDINVYAFAECYNLTTIIGGDNVVTVESNAFTLKQGKNTSYVPKEKLYDTNGFMTHLYTESNTLKGLTWSGNYNRVLVNKVTLMDYEGTKTLIEFSVPKSDSISLTEIKKLCRKNGIDEDTIPKGIATYAWYKIANGKKEDRSDNYMNLTNDIVLYGKPMKQVDWIYDFDVSDGKKVVMDSRTFKSATVDFRDYLMYMGINLTIQAAFADATETNINNYDREEFEKWIYGNTIYFNPVSASDMQPNEKLLAEGFYSSVTTCLHASDTKNEESVLALKIEKIEDEEGGINQVLTFESVEHDGVENVILAEFGALNLGSEANDMFDGFPLPINREEDGTNVGFKSLTINVNYGQTKETPTPAPTPTPSVEPSSTPTPTSTPDVDIRDEIPYAENVPVDEKEAVIKAADTDKNDVEGSVYQYLKLKPASVKKNSIKIKWQKIKGADGYIIYGNKCGSKMEYITTIKKATATSYTAKNLKKGTYYKYLVVAYKTTASGDKVITTSKSVHIVTTGGKKGNPTSLKLKKSKFTLKKGKTAKIKASFKKKKKVATHIAKFRYESTDPAVATVSKSGKVKAVGKGSCKINVYTQNGLMKTVSIKVK
ncbi:MAG: leucine-rich repeat protein [Eubacterium sp.]|nr:leucine-rich repeat protein [Eubacterium sp.]